MKSYPSYELSSENRSVPIFQYAKGHGFDWERLMHAIGSNTFDPKDFDMLHALNWMKRHVQNYAKADANLPENAERLAATDAWCSLYPVAPIDVQAHMVFMLQDTPQAQIAQMRARPEPWMACMEKAWARREDIALWKALCIVMPEHAKKLSLEAAELKNAVLLLLPHVHGWIKDTSLTGSVSDLVYNTLMSRAEPALKERLDTFRLLYPDIGDMPKASVLNAAWDSNFTKDQGERMKLDHCMQLASNLLQLDTHTTRAEQMPVLDLPPSVFESLP